MNQYSQNMSNKWIQPQDQAFEYALAPFPESIEPQWENVATNVIDQPPVDGWDHYQTLIPDYSDFASQDTLSYMPQLGASNPPLINWSPTAVSGIEHQWESFATYVIGEAPGNFYQSLLVDDCGDFMSRGTLPQKLQSGASNPPRVTCLPVATVPYTHDVSLNDSGHVELLNYKDNKYLVQEVKDNNLVQEPIPKEGHPQQMVPRPRKKALPWTEEEHRLFLRGLQKYGRGDWKSISRFVVVSKTPSQVASHAQKYFLRQSAAKKERKRSSIHDITLNDSDLVPHTIIEQQRHNEIPTSIGPMHQFQEMQQVQQMYVPMNQFQEMQQTQQMHQLNPPNNMLHQMSGSVDFDNDARIESIQSLCRR